MADAGRVVDGGGGLLEDVDAWAVDVELRGELIGVPVPDRLRRAVRLPVRAAGFPVGHDQANESGAVLGVLAAERAPDNAREAGLEISWVSHDGREEGEKEGWVGGESVCCCTCWR